MKQFHSLKNTKHLHMKISVLMKLLLQQTMELKCKVEEQAKKTY